MADYSLDDIIRLKRPQFAQSGIKQRLGLQKNARQGVVRPQAITFATKNTPLSVKSVGGGGGIQDARMKIMQKQRLKVKDARDKLNLLARKTDARQRLQKMQAGKVGTAVNSTAITRNLKTNPTTANFRSSPLVITTLQSVPKTPQKQITFSKQGLTVVQRQANPIWSNQHRTAAVETNRVAKKPVSNPSGILITTRNETAIKRKMYQDDDEDEVRQSYTPKKIKISTQTQPATVSGNNNNLSPNRLSANLQARLGASSEGISPLQGYKIFVSNLHPIVTQEDIIELFGDIGPLRRAMLLKQGTAEVVFVKPDDAKTAVETYHNRQLDGQPMTCKLVTPLTPGGESIAASTSKSSNTNMRMQQSVVEARVTPDISVIHKALFNKKPTASQKDIFTITMS